jgi:hypothetical protein
MPTLSPRFKIVPAQSNRLAKDERKFSHALAKKLHITFPCVVANRKLFYTKVNRSGRRVKSGLIQPPSSEQGDPETRKTTDFEKSVGSCVANSVGVRGLKPTVYTPGT